MIVAGVWTGVGMSNMKNYRTRIKVQKYWNRSGVGVWKSDSGHLWTTGPEVYRIRISRLESDTIQHILNKPYQIRTAVLFKFTDQDFQISLFWDLTPTQS